MFMRQQYHEVAAQVARQTDPLLTARLRGMLATIELGNTRFRLATQYPADMGRTLLVGIGYTPEAILRGDDLQRWGVLPTTGQPLSASLDGAPMRGDWPRLTVKLLGSTPVQAMTLPLETHDRLNAVQLSYANVDLARQAIHEATWD